MFIMSHIINEFDGTVKSTKSVLEEAETFVEDKESFKKIKFFYIQRSQRRDQISQNWISYGDMV